MPRNKNKKKPTMKWIEHFKRIATNFQLYESETTIFFQDFLSPFQYKFGSFFFLSEYLTPCHVIVTVFSFFSLFSASILYCSDLIEVKTSANYIRKETLNTILYFSKHYQFMKSTDQQWQQQSTEKNIK